MPHREISLKALQTQRREGLYLEVKQNGTKAWRYRFKLPKHGKLKESVFAIGDDTLNKGFSYPYFPFSIGRNSGISNHM